jgi:hypothetical protein
VAETANACLLPSLPNIYQKLRELLMPPPEPPKPEIGFGVKEETVPYRVRRKTGK